LIILEYASGLIKKVDEKLRDRCIRDGNVLSDGWYCNQRQ